MKLRNTIQKKLIQEEIDKFKTFFTAEELHNQITKTNPDVGIATVYRYLKEQKAKKELYSYTCNKKQTYSKDNKSHCHFICEETGKTIHFEIDSLDFLKDKIPGKVTSFQIEVHGICTDCKEEKENKKNKGCNNCNH